MVEIFKFYLSIINKLFNQVLNGFELTQGLGFGTFLLGCGIFVIFVNLLKFRLSSNGLETLKSYHDKNKDEFRKIKINENGKTRILKYKER